ncbi:MAG: DUF2283 domain-containing protein [Candidatus Methanoperedens sp.]|nr:DUF2283 domain-containing protein [Candidatus Methanoperedens sp.]MCZ7406211.1 DUF2283 domain-containing protein [Candidatus Methanoperedens sp.]
MKLIYDPKTDILTLILRDAPVKESDEIKEGVIVDYGADDKVVSIEMLDASDVVSEPQSLLYEVKAQKATA